MALVNRTLEATTERVRAEIRWRKRKIQPEEFRRIVAEVS